MLIRLAKPDDERPLKRLIMAYLKDTFSKGGDFPPTLENAAAFAQQMILGAAEGDPCLVVDEDGMLVGFAAVRGIHFPGMEVREKACRSWGSYMAPAARSKGYGSKLFMVAGRLARTAGYDRLIAMTHGTDYEVNSLRAVAKLAEFKEVGRILSMDLHQMRCMNGRVLDDNLRLQPAEPAADVVPTIEVAE